MNVTKTTTYLEAKLLFTRTIPTLHPLYMALAIILFTVDERSPSPLTLLPPRGVRGEVVGTFAGV